MSDCEKRVDEHEKRIDSLENFKAGLIVAVAAFAAWLGAESFYLIPKRIDNLVGENRVVEELERLLKQARHDAEEISKLLAASPRELCKGWIVIQAGMG